jgi:hypothetical protein
MTHISVWLILIGCVILESCARIYPPAAFVDRVAPIYPDARPQNCNVALLTDAPTEPYEIFAQIACYAGSADMSERMLTLIKTNACDIGADAIVIAPLQHSAHSNTDNTYPDWVVDNGFGQGGRFQHWVDKRYNVSQKAVALIYKKNVSSRRTQPES